MSLASNYSHMPDPHLLIVDDDREMCELLTTYLSSEGFRVSACHTGRDGLEKGIAGGFDVMILDLMIPELGGMEVLRRLRAKSSLPVLMLTANPGETERILGLEVGADDYMHKPFNPRELTARIRAILRRLQPTSRTLNETLELGDVVLKLGSREAVVGGRPLSLTSIEFDLLTNFLRKPGIVWDRSELTEAVLGHERMPYERAIDVHVSNLRRKLGKHPDSRERLQSIRAVGYIYTAPGDAHAT